MPATPSFLPSSPSFPTLLFTGSITCMCFRFAHWKPVSLTFIGIHLCHNDNEVEQALIYLLPLALTVSIRFEFWQPWEAHADCMVGIFIIMIKMIILAATFSRNNFRKYAVHGWNMYLIRLAGCLSNYLFKLCSIWKNRGLVLLSHVSRTVWPVRSVLYY
jgi:hypothetical protein